MRKYKDSSITDEKTIEVLKALCKKNKGLIMPEVVVDEARSVTSPLHKYFTWSDSEAAEKYRIEEAKRLLRVTVIYLPGENGGYTRVRAFQSLTTDRNNEGGYRTTVSILSSEKYRKQLIADALNDMKSFRQRYNCISALADVFKEMGKAEIVLKTK